MVGWLAICTVNSGYNGMAAAAKVEVEAGYLDCDKVCKDTPPTYRNVPLQFPYGMMKWGWLLITHAFSFVGTSTCIVMRFHQASSAISRTLQ